MPILNTLENIQKSSFVCTLEMMLIFTGCTHAPEQDNQASVWQDATLYQHSAPTPHIALDD